MRGEWIGIFTMEVIERVDRGETALVSGGRREALLVDDVVLVDFGHGRRLCVLSSCVDPHEWRWV
jgi:hypothetical protein